MAWPVNARTSLMMDEAEAIYGATITATQGSPSTSVSASAGTHDGEGVIDVVGADLDAIVYAMRMVGFAAWHRTTAEGFTPHVHGVAVGEPDLSPAAEDQVTDYLEGRNGLATNAPDNGPREFVGQTWEGYLAGDSPAGPVRSFRGVQLGIDDVIIVSGDLEPYSGPTGIFDNVESRADSQTVTLVPGDEFYVYLTSGDFEATDIISMIYWRLNASGHGTLQLAESFDPDYSYSPPFDWTDLGSVVVDTDTLALTATQGIAHAPEEMNGDDGAILLRITCVSGTVTLDWLVLQVEPPSGLQVIDATAGHWSTWRVPGAYGKFPSYKKSVGVSGSTSATATRDEPGLPDDIDDTQDAAMASAELAAGEGTWVDISGPFSAENRKSATAFWHKPNATIESYDSQTTASFGSSISTADWETWPDERVMPNFMTGLVYGVDYSLKPGASGSPSDPENVGEFEDGDTQSVAWSAVDLYAYAENRWTPIINPTLTALYAAVVSTPGNIVRGGSLFTLPNDYVEVIGAGTESATAQTTAGTGPPYTSWTPAPGTGWTLAVGSSLDGGGSVGTPTSGWEQGDGALVQHAYSGVVGSDTTPSIRVQMPDYRYWIPAWVRSPDALDTTPPEGVTVTWLRQRQRNDGLGNSVYRAKGTSSQQMSLRQRGYR